MKDEEKVEKKDTIQNETENKKEQKEEKKDCIIDPKQHELDELNDRYKRVLAEFENYKKRSSKERETLYNSFNIPIFKLGDFSDMSDLYKVIINYF